MKKKLNATAVCLLAVLSGMAQSGNKVYVNNFSVSVGNPAAVSVNLANPENAFCAFQFDLVLPDGITVALNKKGKLDAKLNEDRKDDDHTLSVEQIETGHYRFVCFSMSNATFYGSDGSIVDLTIEASETAAQGTLTGSIEGVVLTKSDRSDIKPDGTTFSITVGTTTGIGSIAASEGQRQEVYDLTGRRVNHSPVGGRETRSKGLYIVNGRKVAY